MWDVTVFTKNRERSVEGDVAKKFFAAVLDQARAGNLLSDEHFTVDGTFVEAWASHKSFKPKDDAGPPTGGSGGKNPEVDFKGSERADDTHASTSDPDARLYKKNAGSASRLGYLGHALTENRNGLVMYAELTLATGTAERVAALAMIERMGGSSGITLGADKGYDAAAFVEELRVRNVTPHIAQNTTRRRSAIDGRTTRHEGYEISQRKRKRVEEVFGWAKVVGTIWKVKVRGRARVSAVFTFAMAAYNIVRIRNIMKAVA